MKNKTLNNQMVRAILIGVAVGMLAHLISSYIGNSKNELTDDSKTVTSPKIPPAPAEKTSSVDSVVKEIKTLKINPKRTLFINEVITFESERFADQILELGDDNEPIVIIIDSPGGSVISGEKNVSAIESVKSDVYTVCNGVCASMAAIIHQYGTKRFATDRSVLMFHDAAGIIGGRLSEMLSLLTMLRRKIEKANHYIANRSNLSYEELVRLEANNFWIDAEDGIEKGLVDGLIRIKR